MNTKEVVSQVVAIAAGFLSDQENSVDQNFFFFFSQQSLCAAGIKPPFALTPCSNAMLSDQKQDVLEIGSK